MFTNPTENTSQEVATSYPPAPTAAAPPQEWLERWRFLLPSMLLISILGQFYWSAYPDIYPFLLIFALVTAACFWYVHSRVLLAARRVINASDANSYGGLMSVKRTKGTLYILLMFPPFLFTMSIVQMLVLHETLRDDILILSYSITALLGSIFYVTLQFLRPDRLSQLVTRLGAWLLTLFLIAMAQVSAFGATFYVLSQLLTGSPTP